MAIRKLTRVRLTRLDKVLYPAGRVTKGDVLTYYIRVAPLLLPFLYDRPLTMHRFPDGVEGEGFFEKDAPAGTPEYVEIFTRWSETAGRDVHFVLCNNLDTLIWIANLASLEIHTTLSTAASYTSPDLLLFDIDPEPPLTFDDVIDVALVVREQLAEARDSCRSSRPPGRRESISWYRSSPAIPLPKSGTLRTGSGRISRGTPRMLSRNFPGPGMPGRSLSITSRTLMARPWLPRTASGPRRGHGLHPAPVGRAPARGASRRF